MEYLAKSEVHETTPVDFPLVWGEASLARVKTLQGSAFMEKQSSEASSDSEAILGELWRVDA